jgi:hypothetical protein
MSGFTEACKCRTLYAESGKRNKDSREVFDMKQSILVVFSLFGLPVERVSRTLFREEAFV